ncbi:hypothetical protein LCGC14_2443030 [marine sediment metagenome]|uniref:Uncharacterized protein n=1 Tax=marine sediment metagenome TaxID=412755 RepID=A0A0F9DVG0_9ZZZZ
MEKDFNKWLCIITNYANFPNQVNDEARTKEKIMATIKTATLLNAMFAINNRWMESKSNKKPKIVYTPEGFDLFIAKSIMHFSNKECSNQEALTKVLRYIFNQKNE